MNEQEQKVKEKQKEGKKNKLVNETKKVKRKKISKETM